MPAGYSGTPLPKKLGIKPGHRVGLIAAPKGFELAGLPEGVRLVRRAQGRFDVMVFFTRRAAELERRLERLRELLRPDGGLWIGWPKKSSGLATDLSFDAVQQAGLATGLVDNKVCAIDETWSGLRFQRRTKSARK
ncbi:MAG: DUF3052 domain-containing protein [Thermoanaerobaculia bacterium]|nr:DUF3052 domain-containing protein [Thermoanaerobaculia bacterium]